SKSATVASMRSPSSSPGNPTSTRCMWTPRVPLYSGLCFCSMYRWIRLVFPTARSPTTLIFSLRRRIRKALVSPPGGSKGHRGNYQTSPLPPARLGCGRTEGNLSRPHSDKGRKILHPERVAITLALAVAVVLAGIGVFYVLFASGALTPGAPLLNASAPSAQRDVLSEPETRGLIAFVLSATSLVAAVGLRLFGQRRREWFFAELGVASSGTRGARPR